MRVPSRHMRPLPKDSSRDVFLFVLALFGLAPLLGLVLHPILAIGPLVYGFAILHGLWSDHQARAARKDDTIGKFARSFDLRKSDPWIIRAVYEGLSVRFSVRATDRFKEDIGVDSEELGLHLLDIAERCGRSLTDSQDNPYFGQMHTVGDLVHFLHHQPMTAEAEARSRR